jgi:hypothetical protein
MVMDGLYGREYTTKLFVRRNEAGAWPGRCAAEVEDNSSGLEHGFSLVEQGVWILDTTAGVEGVGRNIEYAHDDRLLKGKEPSAALEEGGDWQ